MSGEMELIDLLTSNWESVGIRRYGDRTWAVSLGRLGDQRGDTGIIYADWRQTGLVCINGGMRQVQSGYHPTRQAALADARDIASRFDELVAGKS